MAYKLTKRHKLLDTLHWKEIINNPNVHVAYVPSPPGRAAANSMRAKITQYASRRGGRVATSLVTVLDDNERTVLVKLVIEVPVAEHLPIRLNILKREQIRASVRTREGISRKAKVEIKKRKEVKKEDPYAFLPGD